MRQMAISAALSAPGWMDADDAPQAPSVVDDARTRRSPLAQQGAAKALGAHPRKPQAFGSAVGLAVTAAVERERPVTSIEQILDPARLHALLDPLGPAFPPRNAAAH